MKTKDRTIDSIRTPLESAGIEFIPAGSYQGEGGPSVRLKNQMSPTQLADT